MSLMDIFKVKKDNSTCVDCGCHNYMVEFSEDNPVFSSYISNGVMFDDAKEGVKLSYTGLLPRSGADNIYAVVGKGDNNNWSDVKYYPMNKVTQNYFEVLLPLERNTSINIAFKDDADNWDNNLGRNYTYNSH